MGLRSVTPDSPPRTFSPGPLPGKHLFGFGLLDRIRNRFSKDTHCHQQNQYQHNETNWKEANDWLQRARSPSMRAASARRVDIGLPRQTTFKRQNSERREKLCPAQPLALERRAMSTSGSTALGSCPQRSQFSPPPLPSPRISAPAMLSPVPKTSVPSKLLDVETVATVPVEVGEDCCHTRPDRPASIVSSDFSTYDQESVNGDVGRLEADLDTRWILNLSMQFRDRSEREKFFITYAETPTKWRRVTISCDYRDAEADSLELDLKELRFQRDKNRQIYESICDYLPDIQFYDTVTNLKLKTTEGRLHVHVTEDVNEIINYPPRSIISHILDSENFRPLQVSESDLEFDSHLSGYVFKVKYRGKFYIKKEIPGPDNIDEFLYEINALHALHDCSHVIQLEGIVMDDTLQHITGLLIEVAEQGAVVDLLYDHHGKIPWRDRVRWARHAVQGLSEVHGEGYVQGDFTLSNVVVDGHGNAKVIDINRRGCPVGWEPPELAQKIASNQKILMYIGEKTDLYQLGMTLWALAMDDDEPERHDQPLSIADFPDEIPRWYCKIVNICLSDRPRDRLAAKELLRLFPGESCDEGGVTYHSERSLVRGGIKYIEPQHAVELDDIERYRQVSSQPESRESSVGSSRHDHRFTYPRSSNYFLDSSSSAVEVPRGRSPTARGYCTSSEQIPVVQPARSYSDGDQVKIICISPGAEPEHEELEMDGKLYRFPKNEYSFTEEDLKVLRKANSCPHLRPEIHVSEASILRLDQDIPQGPAITSRTSINSGSTPKNSNLALPTTEHDSVMPRSCSFIRHDPADKSPIPESTDEVLQTTKRNNSMVVDPIVPHIPYADSGYDEPLTFAENVGNPNSKLDDKVEDHHEVLDTG